MMHYFLWGLSKKVKGMLTCWNKTDTVVTGTTDTMASYLNENFSLEWELPLLPLFFGGRKEASRWLPFEWKIRKKFEWKNMTSQYAVCCKMHYLHIYLFAMCLWGVSGTVNGLLTCWNNLIVMPSCVNAIFSYSFICNVFMRSVKES